jgi:predicted RNase H-related nuclease YkuK (DUF458 family)
MAKRITYVATRADPATNWYHQTAESSSNSSWNQRLYYMAENHAISTNVTETATTLTSVVTCADESTYNEFTGLTQEIVSTMSAYCAANGITYEITVEDV